MSQADLALPSHAIRVQVNFRNRGEQSITLADELEQDIIVCFDTVIKQHKEAASASRDWMLLDLLPAEVSRKIHSDVQLVTKYAQDTLLN